MLYILFTGTTVISGGWVDDNERLFMVKKNSP